MSDDDPYRWLQENTDKSERWQEEQTGAAVAALHGWAGFEDVRAGIARCAFGDVAAPWRMGGRWFRVGVPAGGALPALLVADKPWGEPRVVVDAEALGKERGVPVGMLTIDASPDGSMVAVGLYESGTEDATLHLFDCDTGEVRPERFPRMFHGAVAWLPDGSGFYYTACYPDDEPGSEQHVWFHRLGSPVPSAPEPVDNNGQYHLGLQVSGDGRWVAMVEGVGRARPSQVQDRGAGGRWRPFLVGESAGFLGTFVGDEYVAVTTVDAPRGRVVAIPMAGGGDRSTWREVIPESEAVLRNLGRTPTRLVLSEFLGGRPRVRVCSLDGEVQGTVPFDADGCVGPTSRLASEPQTAWVVANADESATYVASSAAHGPVVHRCALDGLSVEALTVPEAEAPGIVTRRVSVTADDGVDVPVSLIHRADLDPARPAPALIYVYGGFGCNFLPGFEPRMVPFLEAGGVLVRPQVRGEGAFGDPWWEAGRFAHKQRTLDDLHAVAEWLVASGVAPAGGVAVMGESNGGVIVSISVTQRPDLWCAAVANAALTDLLGAGRDPWTGWVVTLEYGDPADPDDAARLAALSPCQNVRTGVEYPAVLLTVGANDRRTPPWHSRVFTARLQEATGSDRPVLLQVQGATGHGGGAVGTVVDHWAEHIAFVMQQLGMPGTPPARPVGNA